MVTTEINELGSIHIWAKVIAFVAAQAALTVSGVVMLASTFTEKIGKAAGSRGIDVAIDGMEAELTVRLIVRHGVRIPDLAVEVQQTVKSAVETLCECVVTAVHITVQDVIFEDALPREGEGRSNE